MTCIAKSHPVEVGAAIFAVAVAARLVLILTAHFMGDQVLFWGAARRIANGTQFPLLGPVITGGRARHPGPLLYYVLAIPLLFTSAPEACNAFVAILGAATVVIYWQSLRSYFGESGSLLAAVLMACMPWSTLFADRIWNPNIIGFFVATALWAACRLRTRPGLGAVVVLFVSMAAMPQFHMSSPMVWVALLPIWLPSVRKWRWRWALIATFASAVLYIPMMIFEIRTHGSNTIAFLRENSSNGSLDYRRVPLWAFRLLTLDVSYNQLHGYWGVHTEREMLSLIFHGNSDFRYGPLRAFFLVLSVAFAALAVGVAVWSAWNRVGRRKPRPFFWAAVLGVVVNTALLRFAHKEIYGHYVQPLLPFYFVAFAELGRWAMRSERTSIAVWVTALVVCIGGIDAAVWVSRTMDARSGLVTIRRVIAAVEADQPLATNITLGFDFFKGSTSGYNAIASLDPKRHVTFANGGQYRLLLRDAPRPMGATPILLTGPVILYRMLLSVPRRR